AMEPRSPHDAGSGARPPAQPIFSGDDGSRCRTVGQCCAEGESSMTALSFSMKLLGWNAAARVWHYHPRRNFRPLCKYAFFLAERAYRIARDVDWFEPIVGHEARSKRSL